MYMLRRNLFNAIYVLDLSDEEDLKYLVEDVQMLIDRRVPIRFGFVPLLNGQDGEATGIAKLTHHLIVEYGRKHAMSFLREV